MIKERMKIFKMKGHVKEIIIDIQNKKIKRNIFKASRKQIKRPKTNKGSRLLKWHLGN